jgi:hypothetical protein
LKILSWADQINVVGADAMTKAEQIKELMGANQILVENVFSDESFAQEDREQVRDKIHLLTLQLAFWVDENNEERFFYDLKDHVNWMLKNFS